MNPTTRPLARLALAAVTTTLLASGVAAASAHEEHAADDNPSAHEVRRELNQLRQAYRQYADPAAAVAAGWIPTDTCVELPDGSGGMGFHYVNPALLQAAPDASRPPILVYAPLADGSRRLAAVEWMAPDADQDLSTSPDRPVLFGRGFDGPMPGHEPGMPVHYDLHAWVFTPNPDGMFAAFNPLVDC